MAALLPGIVFSAAAPASPATKEEVIELSPFVVATQTDTGYAATNTLEGSRLNTALRDTPAAISIFTKDLLDDLGATTMEEILRYDLSAEVSFGDGEAGGTGNQASNFAEGFSFRARGLGASFSTLVVAEMMGVKSGIGWYLQWAQGWAAYANMYAALLIMALACSGLITGLFLVRDRLLAWQKGAMKW